MVQPKYEKSALLDGDILITEDANSAVDSMAARACEAPLLHSDLENTSTSSEVVEADGLEETEWSKACVPTHSVRSEIEVPDTMPLLKPESPTAADVVTDEDVSRHASLHAEKDIGLPEVRRIAPVAEVAKSRACCGPCRGTK